MRFMVPRRPLIAIKLSSSMTSFTQCYQDILYTFFRRSEDVLGW